MSGVTRTTIDHDLIRRWAEARGGAPSRVAGTQRDGAGLLRIMFSEPTESEALERISWDDFFAKFDEKELALAYQEATADGEISRFNRFVSRSEQ